MKNTYALVGSTSAQMLETGLTATQSRLAVAAEAETRRPVPPAQGASLPVLLRDLRRGHRFEDVVWAALAVSSALLLALSLWL